MLDHGVRTERPIAAVARLDQLVERDGPEGVELADDGGLQPPGRLGVIGLCPALRLRDDDVDDAEFELVGGGHPHREGRGRGPVRRAPQDRRAALRADDGVDGVLEGDDHVADGDGERTARASLPGDDRHDRGAQAGHQPDRAGDGLGDAALLGLRAGVGAGDVDEGHDGQAEPLAELHEPHRLAIALRVGHPEVAADVLLRLGALLLAEDDDPSAVDRGQAADDGGVVAEQAVAVELDEVVGHRREQLEGVGPLEVSGQLDACPDRGLRVGRRQGWSRRSRPAADRPRRAAPPEHPVNHGRPPASGASASAVSPPSTVAGSSAEVGSGAGVAAPRRFAPGRRRSPRSTGARPAGPSRSSRRGPPYRALRSLHSPLHRSPTPRPRPRGIGPDPSLSGITRSARALRNDSGRKAGTLRVSIAAGVSKVRGTR